MCIESYPLVTNPGLLMDTVSPFSCVDLADVGGLHLICARWLDAHTRQPEGGVIIASNVCALL